MATRYRKKPVEVEAVRFDGNNGDEILAWADDHNGCAYVSRDANGTHLLVYTLHGVTRCDVGDYVVHGVAGDFYPCRADVFPELHEAVEVEQ